MASPALGRGMDIDGFAHQIRLLLEAPVARLLPSTLPPSYLEACPPTLGRTLLNRSLPPHDLADSYRPPPNRKYTPLSSNSRSLAGLTTHGQYSVRHFAVRMFPHLRHHFPDMVIPFPQLPLANCFSLEVMLAALYATIYMCSQRGISL